MSWPWLIIGSSAAALLAIGGPDGEVATADCLLGLKPALVSGDFSGSVDCQHDQLSVEQVGQVRTHGRDFTIYSYNYQLAPPCPECAVHGGQRIIFMEDGRYVGQYKPDGAEAIIRDGNLSLEAPNDKPVPVEFTSEGPPNGLLVDGELLSFFR